MLRAQDTKDTESVSETVSPDSCKVVLKREANFCRIPRPVCASQEGKRARSGAFLRTASSTEGGLLVYKVSEGGRVLHPEFVLFYSMSTRAIDTRWTHGTSRARCPTGSCQAQCPR